MTMNMAGLPEDVGPLVPDWQRGIIADPASTAPAGGADEKPPELDRFHSASRPRPARGRPPGRLYHRPQRPLDDGGEREVQDLRYSRTHHSPERHSDLSRR